VPGIVTYSEHPRTALELQSVAASLGAKVGGPRVAAWVGPNPPADLGAHGAQEVVHLTGSGLDAFTTETYTDALAALVEESKPEVILIGATRNGKDLAGRLAARLQAGSISEATKVSVAEGGAIEAERTFLSGNAVQVVRAAARPVVITLPPRAFPLPEKSGAPAAVRQKSVTATTRAPQVVEEKKKAAGGLRIEDAQFIISGGRGFKKKEDLAILEDLAKAVGAEVGCSRPLATDLAWMTEDHWVGLSGHKVAPKVYMTLGISGQIQHIAGIRDSGFIISVNNDPNAPIFKACDLGVVADLYKFIPALKAEVAKAKA
jgi:electron transfer flavoprotein alpha subunit